MKTYSEVLKSNSIFDASGIDNPNKWLWDNNSVLTGNVYYPVIEMKLKTGLPETIQSIEDAKKLLTDLHNNDMHLRDTVYKQHWDLLIAHPPCTYLAVTANKWLKDQPKRKSGALVGADRRQAQQEAIIFFMMLYNAPINKICIENPVGIMSTVFRKPDQILQPFNFGHKEQKKTCLWLKGLPRLNATNIVEPEPYHITKSGKTMPKWYAYADKSKGQKERAKIRSKTFGGIAAAMAQQWNF